jgi:nitroreductase
MTPTIDLLLSHRSIRHFTDEPITEAQREAIINSARATSSSSFPAVQLHYSHYRPGDA